MHLRNLPLLALLLLTSPLLAGDNKAEKKPAATPAPAATSTERGIFRIFAGGKPVGTEVFEITTSPEGTDARAEIHVTVEGQTASQTARLSLGPTGLPRTYEWSEEKPTNVQIRVRFQEDKAIVEFPMESGATDQREFFFTTPEVVVLDNSVFHHFIFLLRHYDFAKGGRQTVHVLVPREVLPGIVYLESRGKEEVNVGKSRQRLERVAVLSEDNEIGTVWVDEQKRVVKIELPQTGFEVVRE